MGEYRKMNIFLFCFNYYCVEFSLFPGEVQDRSRGFRVDLMRQSHQHIDVIDREET